jgi:hypothetical protein
MRVFLECVEYYFRTSSKLDKPFESNGDRQTDRQTKEKILEST